MKKLVIKLKENIFLLIGILFVFSIYTLILKWYNLKYYPVYDDFFVKMAIASMISNELKIYGRILAWNIYTNDIMIPSSDQIFIGLINFIAKSPRYSCIIYIYICIIVCYLGIFTFLNKLVNNSKISFIGGLLYVFSLKLLDDLLRGHLSIITGYCLLPLVIYHMKMYYEKNDRLLNLIEAAFIFSLILSSHLYNTIIYIIPVVLYIIFESIGKFTNNKREGFFLLCKGLKIILISFILSAWFFALLVLSNKGVLVYLGRLASSSIRIKLKYSSDYAHALIFMPKYLLFRGAASVLQNNNSIFFVFLFANVFITFISIFPLLNLKKYDSYNVRIYIFAILLAISSITLSLGPRTYVGIIFSSFFPGLRVFERFLYLYIFSIVIMLSFALKIYVNKIKRLSNLRSISISTRFLIVLFLLLSSIIIPFLVLSSNIKIYTEIDDKLIKGFNIIKKEELKMGDELLPYIISYPSYWSGSPYLVYKGIPIQGLSAALGPLINYPIPFLSSKSIYIYKNELYGPNSYLNNIILGKYYSSEVSKVLSLLGIKYVIILPEFFDYKVIRHIYKLVQYDNGLNIIYNSTKMLIIKNNLYSGRIRAVENAILALGGLHIFPSFLSAVSNSTLSKLFMLHTYFVKNKDDLLNKLNISDTILFGDDSSILDIIYLMEKNKVLPTRFVSQGKITELSQRNIGKYTLSEEVYKVYAGSHFSIYYNINISGSYRIYVRIYMLPANISLSSYLDGSLLKRVSLTTYPGYGYKWIDLGYVDLNSGMHVLDLVFSGDQKRGWTYLDTVMFLKKDELERSFLKLSRLILNKEYIYVISPGYNFIEGSNIHIENDPYCADGYAIKTGWKKDKNSIIFFNISVAYVKNESYNMLIRVKTNRSSTIKLEINKQSSQFNIPNTYDKYKWLVFRIGKSLNKKVNMIILNTNNKLFIDEIIFIPSYIFQNWCIINSKKDIYVRRVNNILSSIYYEILFKKEGINVNKIVVNIPYNNQWELKTGSYTIKPLSALGFMLFYSDFRKNSIQRNMCKLEFNLQIIWNILITEFIIESITILGFISVKYCLLFKNEYKFLLKKINFISKNC